MKINKHLYLVSILFLLSVFGVFFLDLARIFKFSDFSFSLASFLYILFILFNRSTSKLTFYISLFIVFFMGISYLQNGFDTITERIGEWLYIFFVFGLVQYAKELRKGAL